MFLAQLERRKSPRIENNFTIKAIGETCLDKKNGTININALIGKDYILTINGKTFNFLKTITIEGLSSGVYNFCITIEGDTFEQYYQATIESGASVAGKININKRKATINISEGIAPYTVLKNEQTILETYQTNFSIDVNHGDAIQVKSKAACQGELAKHINLLEDIKAYPNPSRGVFKMFIPANIKSINLEVYNIQSQLISSKIYQVIGGVFNLNISKHPNGIYFVKVNLDKPVFLKVIKK